MPKTSCLGRKTWTFAAALFLAASAPAVDLFVEAPASRSPEAALAAADAAVARYAERVSAPDAFDYRVEGRANARPAPPVRVFLTKNGTVLPTQGLTRSRAGDLTLSFDSAGDQAFPSDVRSYLQSVWTSAESVLTTVFGQPSSSATVAVKNFDATIQDRYAVLGGYYVPNAPGGPQIRMPVYNRPTTQAINFVNLLALAYLGDARYPADAYNHGLTRAAAMRVAQTPNAIPIPSPFTEADLQDDIFATYDVVSFYDWYNQPGLGAETFIAGNLLDTPLPPGGSVGGLYLLRNQMAGSAWQKAVVENPGLLAEFNRLFYTNPSLYQTEAQLSALLQTALNTVTGTAGATIEGLSAEKWIDRQFILDFSPRPGRKLVVQPIPLAPNSTEDFGVFNIAAHLVERLPGGDEALLSGISYPIYWRPDFTRFFTTAQDDVFALTAGFGSVTPNFPAATFNNEDYRVAVDVPIDNQIGRTYLPAGSVWPGGQALPNNVYGSVLGLDEERTDLTLELAWTGGTETVPVQNAAFGLRVEADSFQPPQRVTFRVKDATDQVLLERRVNKGLGPIGVTLSTQPAATFNLDRQARLNMFGLPVQPWRPAPLDVLNQLASETLLARWMPEQGAYRLFPALGQMHRGEAFFSYPSASGSAPIRGEQDPGVPATVALQPGWNMVGTPLSTDVPLSRVFATSAAEAVSDWDAAAGDIVGVDFFEFVPDPGNPSVGTLAEADTFEAGKGYFVRCLRPDGAVLIFAQESLLRSRGDAIGRDQAQAPALLPHWRRSLPLPGYFFTPPWFLSPKPSPVPPKPFVYEGPQWSVRVRLNKVGGGAAEAVIGQHPEATRFQDDEFDSGLPPAPTGLQVVVDGPDEMYRETRSYGSRTPYQVRLTGLILGHRYWLSLVPEQGQRTLTLIDPSPYRIQEVRGQFRYSFVAEQSEKTIEIRPGGLR